VSDNLRDIRAFLLDLDGTLYLGGRLFAQTLPFLQALKRTGRRRLFLTNNSSRSGAEYVEKLRRLGIDAEPRDVLTSAHAAITWLQDHAPSRRIYLMAPPGVEAEFRSHGFTLTDERPDQVVLTFDTTLTYEKLRTASNLLHDGVPFLATHPDRVCPTEGHPIPDCGAMAALFREATGVAPKVVGKPEPEMIAAALERLDAAPGDTAIVGDRLYTDMAMGHRAGLRTILVLSGETRREDLECIEQRPDLVVNSVGDIAALLAAEKP
jgi:HAD superfamily hydrolase (TIGR01450 family)